jgi:ADP-ribosylation factor related protein 1
MYTLLTGLYEQYTRRDKYYILILGLDNSGKTTLFERIKYMYTGKTVQVVPTIGQNMSSVPVSGVILTLWDLGGQASLQKLWASYYHQAHAVVFCIDSTDKSRIKEVKQTFKNVLNEIENIPLLVLANKQDCDAHMDITEIQEIFNQVAVGMDARESRVMAISALEGTGVDEACKWLVSRVSGNKESKPPE